MNLLLRNFGEFTTKHFRECRKTYRGGLPGEKLKLSEIRMIVVQHSHECLATVVRMKIKLIHGNVGHTTVARLSRDIFSQLDGNLRICRINVHSMRLQHESCVYIIYLCRKIVEN